MCGREVTFDVYDSVTNFTDSRWSRVVAVFVNGNDWQFRDWKFGNQKRELFARVRAYYIHFEGTRPPPSISGWKVVRFTIPRYKRHNDQSIQTQFWQDLEGFLKRPKFTECGF